jgi:hypothetical protein
VDDIAEETRSVSCIPEKPGLLLVKGRRPANDRGVTAKEIFLRDPLAFT